MVVITHVCSTKVPFKTVGKEFLADRPELERELKNGAREVLRKLAVYVSRKGSMEFQKKRMNIYGKYLPLIAKFCDRSFGKEETSQLQEALGKRGGIEPGSESENAISEETAKEVTDAVAKDVAALIQEKSSRGRKCPAKPRRIWQQLVESSF